MRQINSSKGCLCLFIEGNQEIRHDIIVSIVKLFELELMAPNTSTAEPIQNGHKLDRLFQFCMILTCVRSYNLINLCQESLTLTFSLLLKNYLPTKLFSFNIRG